MLYLELVDTASHKTLLQYSSTNTPEEERKSNPSENGLKTDDIIPSSEVLYLGVFMSGYCTFEFQVTNLLRDAPI